MSETQASVPKRHRVEGPEKHYITYIISILLTMLSFAAVIWGGASLTFVVSFLILLATAQAIFQLAVWMHLKDKGHALPIVGLICGAVVTIGGVVAAVFWCWL